MPADRITREDQATFTGTTTPLRTPIPADAAEKAILAVLAGEPLRKAAALVPMAPARLADAVDLYRTAGRLALDTQARSGHWHQVHLQFPDWRNAEQTAAKHLWPLLRQSEQAGAISSWWFIRKHPCWRLRCQPGQAVTLQEAKTLLAQTLDTMQSRGLLVSSAETIYEPETCAFGGPDGIDAAHRLFHADCRNILSYLHQHDPALAASGQAIGRREVSILLCTQMMRGAGQDWYEQADIWNRVTEHRPLPPGTPPHRTRELTPGMRQLMTTDTRGLAGDQGPLAFTRDWTRAFEQTGYELGRSARNGSLGRGLRDILAHHVIFHWNRIGLTARAQGILAKTASQVAFSSRSSSAATSTVFEATWA